MNIRTVIVLILVFLLAFLSRFAGLLFNDNAKNGYVYTRNFDEHTFTRMIDRYENGAKLANVKYPPAFPTAFLMFYTLSKPYLDTIESKHPFLEQKTFFPRMVSSASSILTAGILFLLAVSGTGSIAIGFITSLFYILSPGGLIASYYGTADSFHMMMFWLSTYIVYQSIKYQSTLISFIAFIVTGFSVGTKWTVSLLPQIVLLVYAVRKKWKWYYFFSVAILLAALGFYLSFGSGSSFKTLTASAKVVRNDNILVKDHIYWLNPITYQLQLVVGVALPCFAFALYGLLSVYKNTAGVCCKLKSNFFALILLNTTAHLFLISTLAIPTTRHTLPLIPFYCIMAGIGLWSFLQSWLESKKRFLITITLSAIFFYQTVAVISAIRPYIETNDMKSMYSWLYKQTNGNKPDLFQLESDREYDKQQALKDAHSADFIVLTSNVLFKFLQSQINPWGKQDCKGSIYHGSEAECEIVQTIALDRNEFLPVKVFTNFNYVPEQMLFEYYWGAYDSVKVKYYVFKSAKNNT